MKKKLIILLFVTVFIIIGTVGINKVSKYPILTKWILGSARIIGEPITCKIKINGIKCDSAKVFHQTTDFSGKFERDYLILFILNRTKSDGRNVLVIDRENKLIRIPNSNKIDYEIIANTLFQSESGAHVMIPINDNVKGYGFEPKLKFEDNTIEFILPNWSEYKISKIEIELTPLVMRRMPK